MEENTTSTTGVEPEAQPADSAKNGRQVKARVLIDCAFGKANEVVTVYAYIGKASPELDTDKAAVAYAESLNRDVAV